jgi:hypothetical protein
VTEGEEEMTKGKRTEKKESDRKEKRKRRKGYTDTRPKGCKGKKMTERGKRRTAILYMKSDET